MQIFNKISIKTILVISLVLIFFGFYGSNIVLAATSPSLGNAATYSILSGTTVTNAGTTNISGNVGISPAGGGGYAESGTTIYGAGSSLHNADTAAADAQTDKNTAYGTLTAMGCGTDGGEDYGAVIKSLNGLTLPPGVYCANQFNLSGTLTLNGPATGVWVFKSAGSLIISSGAAAKVVFTGGGLACNVWWKVVSTATFDAGSSLAGNILADTSITLADGATLDGRALARTASVTLVGNTISGPTCAAAPAGATPVSGATRYGTINVVKTVINDNGRTKTVADFPLFVNGASVISGQTNNFPAPAATYAITETVDPNYTRAFSGDCNSTGHIDLNVNNDAVCIITNNDIGAPLVPLVPPLIDVVKVPSPLSLPAGPGAVTYTYTLRNIGTVPVTDITMVGDTCSPIILVSGDTDADSKLDVNETWVHTCSTTLSATHTNTVVATGWANGISAVDIASAHVVVGASIVPPLIHVVKKPSVFAMLAPGGAVTYTYTVTNPGTEPLSNVSISDDKCTGLPGRVVGHPGDLNKNDLLESNETWTFTCKTKLTKTTTNIGTAEGSANGLKARDFALATVVVAAQVPKLPNTGFAPSSNLPWNIIAPAGLFVVLSLLFVARRKQLI